MIASEIYNEALITVTFTEGKAKKDKTDLETTTAFYTAQLQAAENVLAVKGAELNTALTAYTNAQTSLRAAYRTGIGLANAISVLASKHTAKNTAAKNKITAQDNVTKARNLLQTNIDTYTNASKISTSKWVSSKDAAAAAKIAMDNAKKAMDGAGSAATPQVGSASGIVRTITNVVDILTGAGSGIGARSGTGAGSGIGASSGSLTCGSLGYKGNGIRLYTRIECENTLQGKYSANGECTKKQGGSWSWDCRYLNN